MIGYLQNITKGVEFKLYFSGLSNTNTRSFGQNESTPRVYISKDGATPVVSTNSSVFVGNVGDVKSSMMYVILTADEMNADNVNVNISCIQFENEYNIFAQSISIYTGSVVASTSQSPEAMTSICKAVNLGYSVVEIATDENGYNYYGLTATNNRWWLIIQEKADFTSVGYKMNRENRQSFVNGWANRATLNYSTNFPLG